MSQQLPVMEMFYSLQGEGIHSGTPAFFIRLGGCDVGCPWCDVKESWEAGRHPLTEVAEIVRQAGDSGARLAVVTGGEPLMYNLEPLTSGLAAAGLRRHLETSGAYPLSGEWEWVCVSPKKFKPAQPAVLKRADELKFIVANKHDLHWATEMAAGAGPRCHLLLQPEWSRSARVLPLILDFLKTRPRWRLSLQTQKYLNIP